MAFYIYRKPVSPPVSVGLCELADTKDYITGHTYISKLHNRSLFLSCQMSSKGLILQMFP